jgi:hypothetical protein
LRAAVTVTRLKRMGQIEFEDRTQEPPEIATNRRVATVAQAIIGTTILVSEGDASVGLGALVRALAQGAARTGASLDEVVTALRTAHANALEDLAAIARQRISDA